MKIGSLRGARKITMPDPKKIILHIGSHKTGSTALQRYLDKNRKYLSENNIQYLDGINQNYIYLAFCEAPEKEHELIRQGLGHSAGARAWVKRARKRLDAELAAGTADVLISAEELCRLSEAGIRAMRDVLEPYGDVRVVCYARDPLEYCFSEAQEGLKGGLTYADICAAPPRPDYADMLAGYFAVFGRERVSVRAYQSGHPIQYDFLEALDLPLDAAPPASTIRANSSLSLPACQILSHINEHYPLYIGDQPNPDRAKIAPAWLIQIPGPRFTLPRAVIDRVLEESASDLDWLAERTGVRFDPETRRPPLETYDRSVDPDFIAAVGELVHKLAARLGDVLAVHLTLLANSEGEADDAERLLSAAISAHPPAAGAYQALAKIRTEQGRRDEARALARTAQMLAAPRAARTGAGETGAAAPAK
jgi:hypothetical protein